MFYPILKFGLLSILLPYFLSLASAASCYYPDGSEETSGDYEPCVSTVGTVSMCCATNRSEFADECLPSGLCWNPCATSGFCGVSTGGQYWRESCTDASWSSPLCLKNVCTNPATGGTANGTSAVSQCLTDGSWCCGGDLTSEACCAMNNRVAIAATIGVSTTSTTTSSSSSTSTTSTSISSSSSASTSSSLASTSSSSLASTTKSSSTSSSGTGLSTALPNSSTSGTLGASQTSTASNTAPAAPVSSDTKGTTSISKGGIAGIAVGMSLLFIAVVVAGFIIFKRRKSSNTSEGGGFLPDNERYIYAKPNEYGGEPYVDRSPVSKVELGTVEHRVTEIGGVRAQHSPPMPRNMIYHEAP